MGWWTPHGQTSVCEFLCHERSCFWNEEVPIGFKSQEFIVGIAVAAILICALCASSMFRNIALALAAGGVVLLYLQGGVPALISTSTVLEKEIRALPDFSNGLVVGLAVSAVLLLGMQKRST